MAIDLRYLDTELDSVEHWTHIAADSLLSLYFAPESRFWRSTLDRAADDRSVHPTSTNRSFFALNEYVRFLNEGDLFDRDAMHSRLKSAISPLQSIADNFLPAQVAEVGRCFRGVDPPDSSDCPSEPNPFTASHLLLSVALTENLARLDFIRPDEAEKLRVSAQPIALELERSLGLGLGGKIDSSDEVHDFVSLYAVRSLDAYRHLNRVAEVKHETPSESVLSSVTAKDYTAPPVVNSEDISSEDFSACLSSPTDPGLGTEVDASILEHDWSSKLANRVKETVLSQLGYHAATVSSKYDPIQLAFSAALLNRHASATPDVALLTTRAVQSVCDSQEPDGSWPPARPLSYEHRSLAYVSSYEVALTLTHLLLGQLARSTRSDWDPTSCERLLMALRKAFQLVQANYTVIETTEPGTSGNKTMGWANDHSRRTELVESWATAIVLTFLIHYHEALLQLRQTMVLSQYGDDVQYFSDGDQHVWAELRPVLRAGSIGHLKATKALARKVLEDIADPTEDGTLVNALESVIVEPIIDDCARRPHTASLILWGDPGTRKTSLVRSLARALSWPLLTLSPTDFLRRGGLEGFEAAAAEIFQDLLRLRRVVVLLDECEDFFKDRDHSNDDSGDSVPDSGREPLASRTVGAFITAGMLPRLQKLRDKQWVLFVLATNVAPGKLDKAVTRPGRFDVVQEMPYPHRKARKVFVEKELRRLTLSRIAAASEKEKVTIERQTLKLLRAMQDVLDDHVLETSDDRGSTPKPRDGTGKITFAVLSKFVDQVWALGSDAVDTATEDELKGKIKDFLSEQIERAGPQSLLEVFGRTLKSTRGDMG